MSATTQPDPSRIVLIADDHEVTRFGLARVLQQSLHVRRVLEAARFDTALEMIAATPPELAIFDLDMPGLPGPEALEDLRRRWPEMKLVVLSGSTSRDDILACLAAGAHGYIIKSDAVEELVESLKRVLKGEVLVPASLAVLDPQGRNGDENYAADVDLGRFTVRQLDVLRCLERGMTNKEIARELALTSRTVKMHLSAIFQILGVRNRTHAAAVARRVIRGGGSVGASEVNPSPAA